MVGGVAGGGGKGEGRGREGKGEKGYVSASFNLLGIADSECYRPPTTPD